MQNIDIEQGSLLVRAVFVGHRINVNEFKALQVLAKNPMVYQADGAGYVIVFRYGVIVFVNVTDAEQQLWLTKAGVAIINPLLEQEIEQLEVFISEQQEGFDDGMLNLAGLDAQKLQLIAFVLAKSVVLSFYEKNTAQLFDRIEPLANDLQAKGTAYRHDKELLRHIGSVLSIQSKMVGRAEMGEKPDLLWEHPELERLFQLMEAEYEIRERHLALERKYELISRTVTTLLDWLQYKRTLRVEWYIVILIIVDILISLGEKIVS